MSSENTSQPINSLFVDQDTCLGDALPNFDPNIPMRGIEDIEMFGDSQEPMDEEIRRYILSDNYFDSSETLSQATAGTSSYVQTPQGPDEMAIDPALTATVPSESIAMGSGLAPATIPTAAVEQSGAQVQAGNNESTTIPAFPSTESVPQTAGQPAEQTAAHREPSPEWSDAVARENSLSPNPFGPVRPRRGASRQGAATRGGRRGRGRGRGRVNTADAVHDPYPFFRYPPVDHNPPPENRAGRTRDRSREGRAPPAYVPPDQANAPPGEPNPMGDVRPGEDEEPRAMIWVDAARFDLLLQVCYERRHETLSENAWRRIATGCHGGPFRDASWNAVRLEFSRLMRDRFPGYGQDSPNSDRRRRFLDLLARQQARGRPSDVSPADLDHNVTDASIYCPRPRTGASRASTNNTAQNTHRDTVQAGSSHAEVSSADANGGTETVEPSNSELNGNSNNNNGETNITEASNATSELASNGLPYTRQHFR